MTRDELVDRWTALVAGSDDVAPNQRRRNLARALNPWLAWSADFVRFQPDDGTQQTLVAALDGTAQQVGERASAWTDDEDADDGSTWPRSREAGEAFYACIVDFCAQLPTEGRRR